MTTKAMIDEQLPRPFWGIYDPSFDDNYNNLLTCTAMCYDQSSDDNLDNLKLSCEILPHLDSAKGI